MRGLKDPQRPDCGQEKLAPAIFFVHSSPEKIQDFLPLQFMLLHRRYGMVYIYGTIGMWGVYREVLMAHAQKSPFFLSCVDRFGEKSQKPLFRRQFSNSCIFNSF